MAWNGSGATKTEEKSVRRNKPFPWGVLVVAIVILSLVACLVGWFAGSSTESSDPSTPPSNGRLISGNSGISANLSPQEAVRQRMPKGLRGKQPKGTRPQRTVEMFEHLTGEDRKMAENVWNALDACDVDKTIAAAVKALASPNSEVRQAAVEALGWCGPAALPELTGALVDPDEDVRQFAQNHWELAAQGLESMGDRFNIAAAAFATLSGEDALTGIGGVLRNAALELIDGEDDPERAANNRLTVVQALADIITGGRPENAEAAREAYNDITGNEWLGFDAAERYLADPDNYDPDEDSSVSPMSGESESTPVSEEASAAQGEPASSDGPKESETGDVSEEDEADRQE